MSSRELELIAVKLAKALVSRVFTSKDKDTLLESYLLKGNKGYLDSTPKEILEDYGHYILGYGGRLEVGSWVVSKDKDGYVLVEGKPS